MLGKRNQWVAWGMRAYVGPGVHWSWGNRQLAGQEAFAKGLSRKAIDAGRSRELWELSLGLVGLASRGHLPGLSSA